MTNDNLFAQVAARIVDSNKVLIAGPGLKPMSYSDVLALSGRLANVMAERGVVPGDRVAVQVAKTPQALVLYLAVLRAGGLYLPLNTGYTLAELDYFIGDALPKLFVCDPASQTAIGEIATRHGVAAVETLDGTGCGSLIEAAESAEAEFRTVERHSRDVAAILYTSGTTGRSKGAMLTHGNLLSNAEALVHAWRFTPDDVLIHALPIYHTHGLFVATNTVLLAGASMLFLAKFETIAIMKLIPEATVLMGVPTFYTRLLSDPDLDRASMAGMRLFISGSAPLLAETHVQWREKTGHAILERYGMTETNMNTSNPYDGERVAGSVGLPLPGVEVRIVDTESGIVLPAGEIGMIEVRGANVFKGYWRMPEKTAAEFRSDGFFITGDLGTIDQRGYLSIVGRSKDLIISGGFNVYPKEVEGEIDTLPGVSESAVIGVPHPDFGEGVVAVVVPTRVDSIDEASVQASLRERLAGFKLPKRVVLVDVLPRNAMGKVQKNLLRDRYKDLLVRRSG